MYRRIALWSPHWTLGNVVVADTRQIRREGLNTVGVESLLLWTSSIHTFTMSRTIRLTTCTSNGRVVTSRVIRPHRLAVFPSVRWVLETSVAIEAPATGETLIALPFHDDDWKADTLRYTDWEPRRLI